MLEQHKTTNTLIKHSAAVHVSNKLSATERKIANVLLKNAFHSMIFEHQHNIYVKDLLRALGWSEISEHNEALKRNIENLVNIKLKWNILGKDKKRKWGVSSFLAGAEIRSGLIYYSYSAELSQWLYRPNIYTTLNLDYQKALKSAHGLALWEFCNEQLDTSRSYDTTTEYIEISKIRELLSAEEPTYYRYKHLNDKILKPAIKEVSSKTDLVIDILTKKAGNTVISIAFKIIRSISQLQLEMFEGDVDALDLVKGQIELENILGKAKVLLMDEEQVKKIALTYGVIQVSKVLDIVINKIKGGEKIASIGGYVYTLLDKGIIESTDMKKVREKLFLENKQTQEGARKEEEEIITEIINNESSIYQKAILLACRSVIHPNVFKKALDENQIQIVSLFENKNNITVLLKYSVRFIGSKLKIKKACIEELNKLGKSAVVEIQEKHYEKAYE